MARAPKALEIFWRDENYGSIGGSDAFRCYDMGDLSDTAHAKLLRIFRKHGFEMNHSRGTYIAVYVKGKDNSMRLVEAIEAAGYVLTHSDCVPASVKAGLAARAEGPDAEHEEEAGFRP